MNKKLLMGLAAFFVLWVIVLVIWTFGRGKVFSQASQDTGSVSALMMQAKAFEAKDKWFDAKKTYQKLIRDFPNSNAVMNWQKRLEEINLTLLFSPAVTAGSLLYEIRPGDTLTKIAKEFKTTPDLIMRSNQMSSDRLMPERKIKVWTVPFTIVVDKSGNLLFLKTNEEVFKTYVVATGLNNSTPVGNFKITNKLLNPTWFKAGTVVPPGSPENILGTRWMGFDISGYGIHGTTEPQSLGRQVTQGCVRMLNAEVEELYTIVPVGTEVTIVD
ncbi:MAG: L,D-transpeptidase family protein [Candidatus Omnitrophota bacterium]